MPFIDQILKYRSLSIVGMEKNTGKTECLNYILRRLPREGMRYCITSIGVDGERVDQVTDTSKPEITLNEGVYFATAEKYYKNRNIVSELVDVSNITTSLGRIVTSKVIIGGKVLLAGPSSTYSLKKWMSSLRDLKGVSDNGIDLVIVDGALSRMSLASPSVSEAMILSTGAAYSANLGTLVQKTSFVVELINLPLSDLEYSEDYSIKTSSLLAFSGEGISFSNNVRQIEITGVLTDRFLKQLIQNRYVKGVDLVVSDFTKIFITPQTYRTFLKMGGRLSVREKSKLIAVCVNPTAPNGYVINSDKLCEELSRAINLPVYDIVKRY